MAAFARIVELLAHGIVVGTFVDAAPCQTYSIKAFGGSDLIVAIHSCLVLVYSNNSLTTSMTLIVILWSSSWILANLIVEELIFE